MKYKRITMREFAETTDDRIYNRLSELENKIESGELVDRDEYLDRLMETKYISGMTDKELEFFAKHNARVRENAEAEISRLQAEVAEMRARLEKAVELPCKVGDTVYYIQYFCNYKKCDSITQQICCGCKEMIERERRNEKYVICEKPFELKDLTEIGKKYFTTRAEAEARLKELKEAEEQ